MQLCSSLSVQGDINNNIGFYVLKHRSIISLYILSRFCVTSKNQDLHL